MRGLAENGCQLLEMDGTDLKWLEICGYIQKLKGMAVMAEKFLKWM